MPPFVAIQSVSRWLPQTATWLYTQVRGLEPDVENHIVCESTLHLEQFPHPHIHCLSGEPLWRVVWEKGLRRLRVRRHLGYTVDVARRSGARLLHSHFGDMGWFNAGAARAAEIPHVVTFYGIDVVHYPTADPRWRERYAALFSTVSRVLCEGPHMADCIVALGCSPTKVTVHHLGIHTDQFLFEPRRWTPGEPLRVLLSGSFREKKGFPDAIEALARVQDEADLQVTLIGDEHGTPGTRDEKRRILDALDRTGLAARTRLTGYIPWSRALEEARRHHVFLSPSVTGSDGDTEGGAPVSIIEMAASGMLIISTTHCDIPNVIRHGEAGLLAREHDVEALAGHLRWAIGNPGEWIRYQRAARDRVEREFNAETQGTRLAAIYRDVAGGTT